MNWIPTNFNPLKLTPPHYPGTPLARNRVSYEKKRPARSFLPRQTSFINPPPTTSFPVSRTSH